MPYSEMHRDGVWGVYRKEGGWFTVIKQESHNLSVATLTMFLWDRSWEVLIGYYLGVAMDKEDTVQDQKVT